MAKIELEKRTVGTLGASDTAALGAAFPGTPNLPTAHLGQHTNKEVLALMQTLTNGFQDKNPDIKVDLDFGKNLPSGDPKAAPELADVAVGSAGLPGTPYSPNTASPEANSGLNPTTLPSPPPQLFGGDGQNGSLTSPKKSSDKLSEQQEGGGVDLDIQHDMGSSGFTP